MEHNHQLVGALLLITAFALFRGPQALAQEMIFDLDTARSSVQFTLPATLHTVHGTFKLKPGQIHYNASAGTVAGTLAADAASGETGNDRRDRKMHRDVLQSDRYPEFSFTLRQISGHLAPEGSSEMQLNGVLKIHGAEHELTLRAPVQIKERILTATTQFVVPYASWGLKNPSNMFVHVSDKVTVDLSIAGTVRAATASTAAR